MNLKTLNLKTQNNTFKFFVIKATFSSAFIVASAAEAIFINLCMSNEAETRLNMQAFKHVL
jgi:hypothetical protein